MIVSFACRDNEALAHGERVARWQPIQGVAIRKLHQLNIAGSLNDLRIPPGNRLEALKGNRNGQWSIRINSQYRVCFTWTNLGPAWVEILDYH